MGLAWFCSVASDFAGYPACLIHHKAGNIKCYLLFFKSSFRN